MTYVDDAVVPVTGNPTVTGLDEQLRLQQTKTKLRRIGIALMVLQLAIMIAWNAYEIRRFSETVDFAGFYHVWYLIGHGVLNPVPGWLKSQMILIMYPLALVATVFPHPIALLAIQDVATVLAELVAYFWLVDIIASRPSLPLREWSLFGLATLVFNPWIYWSISWDYHSEAVGVLFLVLASHAFYTRRRTAWLWALLTISCGLVPSTYLVGVGLGLLLAKGRRRAGLQVAAAGCLWLIVTLKLGAGAGLIPVTHQFAAQEASNPVLSAVQEIGTVIGRIPGDAFDMLANLAPIGFIGALTSPVAGVAAVVFGTSATAGGVRSVVPGFQNIAIYIYSPVGTIIALSFISRRFGLRVARVLMVVILVLTLGWAVEWVPKLRAHWVSVPGDAAAALRSAQKLIPYRADLIVSQGVSGVFGGRPLIDELFGRTPLGVGIAGNDVWFLITPYVGTETETVSESASIIRYISQTLHARLAFERDGVWLFEWRRHGGPNQIVLPGPYATNTPAVFRTQGVRNTEGPLRHWSMSSNGKPGYILYGDYWLEPVGTYAASVTLRADGPVQVTFRDATTDKTLEQRTVRDTDGLQTLNLSGAITAKDPTTATAPFRGFGPFTVHPVPGLQGNDLEVQVAALTAAPVTVTSVSVAQTGGSAISRVDG